MILILFRATFSQLMCEKKNYRQLTQKTNISLVQAFEYEHLLIGLSQNDDIIQMFNNP